MTVVRARPRRRRPGLRAVLADGWRTRLYNASCNGVLLCCALVLAVKW